MKKLLLVSAVAITSIVAAMVASSACIWGFYQPVEPKCLREE